jgi:hypothetical protein
MDTYTEGTLAVPLSLSGGYAGKAALNRYLETTEWWLEVSRPGGVLTPGSLARTISMKVRVMRVSVRARVLSHLAGRSSRTSAGSAGIAGSRPGARRCLMRPRISAGNPLRRLPRAANLRDAVHCVRLPDMALPATRTGRTLLTARAALGVATLLVPRLAGKAFFLDPSDNPQLPVIARMWGIRNLSLAAGMYGATGPSRRRWWRLQPAIDGLDFAVIVTEWRRDAVPPVAAGLMAGTALVATVLGSLSMAAESE